MRLLCERSAIAAITMFLLQSLLATAQRPNWTGGTNVSYPSSPPFPIPMNSSSVVVNSASSSVLHGTGTEILSSTVVEAPSSSDTSVLPPEPSTPAESFLPPYSSSTTIEVLSSSVSSLVPSDTLSSLRSNFAPVSTADVSTLVSSTALSLGTGSITVGPFSTESVTAPSEVTRTASSSIEILLPPGITLPPNPSTTLPSTGIEVQSSASELSIVVVDIFPLIQSWIDDPHPSNTAAITSHLNNVLPKATNLLGKLPKPTDGVEPCQSGRLGRSDARHATIPMPDRRSSLGNLFKTAFSLVVCVINTTNKLSDEVIKGTRDAVDTVKKLQDDLEPMIDALNDVDLNNDPESSESVSASEELSSTQSRLSSTSSCTLQTISNCNIGCTAIATTTFGGLIRREERNACTTICEAPITRCDATGVTSVSTVTSTTTTYRLCAPDCADCNPDSHIIPTDAPTLSRYSTASNGVLYLPAPTVTNLDDDDPAAQPRGLLPQRTDSPSTNIMKRGLTNPNDDNYNGNVGNWLRDQIRFSPNRLPHGTRGIMTTGFSFRLRSAPNTWNLVNLYGCTSVIVISRKRMFMTHIWEAPTMRTPQNLQTQVLDSLRNGDAGVSQGLTSFTGAGGDFEDTQANKVRTFIITPYRRGSGENPGYNDLEFPYEVGKIQDLLKDVLGRSDTIIIPYVAKGPDPALTFAFGKVLIQYDPLAALLGRADGGCVHQVAGIELWFEDHPVYRYKDRWTAFPNQVPRVNGLLTRSTLEGRKELRLLRGREVTDADEEEWSEYESLMRRQEGGTCPLRSESVSATLNSSPSATGQDPTTFETSFISSIRDDITTSTIEPLSSMQQPPISTDEESSETPITSSSREAITSSSTEPPSSTEEHSVSPKTSFVASSREFTTTSSAEPPSSTTEPPSSTSDQFLETSSTARVPAPIPKKALSIIMRNIVDDGKNYNSWTFFEISVGSQADGCLDPVLDDEATRWSDSDAINSPPWPRGTFTMTLFGQGDCHYLNDGNSAGVLYCPAMGEGIKVGCKENSERSQMSAITQCSYYSTYSKAFHRAVYCEF